MISQVKELYELLANPHVPDEKKRIYQKRLDVVEAKLSIDDE